MKALLLADGGRVDATAALCAEVGAGIEVQAFTDPERMTRDPDAVAKHHIAIAPIGLRAFHSPFADLSPGSSDAMVRDVARHRFDWADHIARQLDATHVVLHHGYVPGTSIPSRWLARSQHFWTDFLTTRAPGVQFHLENHLERDPELLADVIAAVAHPQLDVCLDVGHAHWHSAIPIVRWIERLGSQIGYIHLHDNHGTDDEHLGLGDGTIPLPDVCQALEVYVPHALWTIETLPEALAPSVAWLGTRGFVPRGRMILGKRTQT